MPNDRRAYLTYDQAIGDELCAQIAEGMSIRQITEKPGMPCRRTVTQWLARYPEFRERYECAMMLLAEFWSHEILEIADDSSSDFIIDERGERIVDHEHIRRSHLRVEARKWLLSKILPKRFGDRVTVDATVRRDMRELTDEELMVIAQGSVPAIAGPSEPDDEETRH